MFKLFSQWGTCKNPVQVLKFNMKLTGHQNAFRKIVFIANFENTSDSEDMGFMIYFVDSFVLTNLGKIGDGKNLLFKMKMKMNKYLNAFVCTSSSDYINIDS